MKKMFTLSAGTPCIDMCSNDMSQQSVCPLLGGSAQRAKGVRKVAFTLAEVLITLAIIGVVAAITIPGLVTKINDKVKNTRITTIEKKLHQGTDKLMILGHINGYETTEDFVKALSEHMKISTYCSADKIAECFPYDKINVEGTKGVRQ